MTLHVIAINTYGSHRVTDPKTKQTVSAYKIGSATTALVLTSLFGRLAHNLTPPRASYHYIQLQSQVSVHSGFILLQIDQPQLDKVLEITRAHHDYFVGVYLWRDEQWWVFPTAQQDFQSTTNRGGPKFNPLSCHPRTIDIDDERPSTANGIMAKKSQRSPDDTPWWWLTGETYPHRQLLKSLGCRWSGQRRAWYYIGWRLPSAIEKLLAQDQPDAPDTPIQPEPEDDAPCSSANAAENRPALALPEPDRKPCPDSPAPARRFAVTPPHQFELGQRVYLAHTLRVSMDGPKEGQLLPMDAAGVVVRRYEYRETPDYRHRLAYDVKFDEHGLHSLFQGALTDQPSGLAGMVTRHEVLPVMFGVRAEDVMRHEMERRQAIPQNYKLLDEMEASTPEPPTPTHVDDAAPQADDAPPPIRRLPAPEPDERLSQIKLAPRSPRAPIQRTALARIEQHFVGELSGSISGSVYCYGYALHKDICILVNLGGPHMAVEAIRARLSKGETVSLIHHNGPSLDLEPGWDDDGAPLRGAYTAFVHNLPEAKFSSMILCHQRLVEPRYQAQEAVYIIRTDQEQAQAHLLKHLRAMLNVAIFDQWADYLWQAGEIASLLSPARAEALDVLAIQADAQAWLRLISGGLARKIIQLPE